MPLNPDLPQPRLRQVLEVLRPSCILTDGIHRALAGQLMPAGEVLQIEDLLQSTPDPAALEHVRAGMTDQDPLYCLFTSGSTGTPTVERCVATARCWTLSRRSQRCSASVRTM